MKKLVQSLFVMLLIASSVLAQDKKITGKVTAKEDGLPLPGVSVKVTGTKLGTQTDANGNYSIIVPTSAKSLDISFVGFLAKTVPLGTRLVLNIILETDAKQLSEVIVNGYSSIKKTEFAGSSSRITSEEIENKPVTSFDQTLAGKAAGVSINTSSGIIGAPVVIRVRGTSSISSGSQPLIVIDGVPVVQGNTGQLYNQTNPLADINPNDIESIDVLKDASASALYGSRAAAGVLLITTKQGKIGASKVTYDTYFGYNEPSRLFKVLDGGQYNTVINKMRTNANLTPIAFYGDVNGDNIPDVTNTDWQKEVYTKGLNMSQQIGVSGGTAKTQYYTSVSYLDYQNFIKVNRLRRATARLNATHEANKWLKFGANSQFTRGLQNGLGSGTGGALSGIPFGPFTYYPNTPVFNQDGTYNYGKGGNLISIGTEPNPVGVLNQNYDNLDSKRFLGSGFAEIKILPELKLRTTYSADYQTGFTNQYWNNEAGDGRGFGNLVQDVYNENLVYNWASTLNYNKVFNKHSVGLLAGAEYNKFSSNYLYAFAYGASDPFYTQFIGSAFTTFGADGGRISNGLESYFASGNYSFDQKYSASATIRSDAYSGYGRDNKTGYFPSGSVAWRVIQEDFMKNINWLGDLKLRASYGLTGNSNIGSYPSLATYSPVTYADLGGSSLGNPGNSALRWEKTAQLDLGLDATIFKSIDLVFDYYDKETNDLILNSPVPATNGFPNNSLTKNIGKLSNKGLEFQISSRNFSKKDFSWNTSFNIAYNKTRVISTNDTGDEVAGGFSVAKPGYDLGVYKLIKWAGVNSQTGLAQFYDINGNIKAYNQAVTPASQRWTNPATGAVVTPINGADAVIDASKTPFPKYIGGLSNDVRYKNFDFNIFVQFSADFYVYNATKASLLSNSNIRNKSVEILNSWTTPGVDASSQKLFYGDATSTQSSTRWLERGDFIRGKSISLGYTIPKTIVKKLDLSRIRIYAQVQNAFTITSYSGIDPEANNGGNVNIGGGVDNYRPYIARTFLLGLNVGF